MTLRLLRSGGRPLIGLLVAALLFKLLVLAAALDSNPLAYHATSDVRYYLDQARGGSGAARASEPFHMPPLYSKLLAAIPGATQDPSTGVLLLQVLAGVLGLALAWLAAARRVGPRLALIAPALCLAYGPLSFFETKRLGDSLAGVLLLAIVCLAESLPKPPRDEAGASRKLLPSALIGGLLGAASLLRPQMLLFAALLTLWTEKRVGRLAGLSLALATLLVLLPSTLHNYSAGAGLVPVSDNGPINLWLANEGPLSGTFGTSRAEFGSIHSQATVARRAAEQAQGSALSWKQVSAHWRNEAFAQIADNPIESLQRVGLRAAALTESFQTGIVSVPEVERQLMPPLRLAMLPFGVLLGLAAGAWIATRKPGAAHASSEPKAPTPSATPALLLSATVVASTLLFFHYERFRLPLVPLLAIAVAVGVGRWKAQRPSASRASLAVIIALLIAAQSFVPRGHHAQVRANGWSSVAEAHLAQLSRGDQHALRAVEAEFATALSADPNFPRALLGHAKVAWLAGDRSSALNRIERAEAVLPNWDELASLRALVERN